jgi:signal peptidase I
VLRRATVGSFHDVATVRSGVARLPVVVARVVAMLVLWAALTLAMGLATLVTVPSFFGYRTLNVLSGSMEPTIEVGAVVVDEVISPLDARVGDVVTFPDPENRTRLITHRLRSIRVKGRTAMMVTKGDANDTVERWDVSTKGRIGRVAYAAPKLGYGRAWIGSRTGHVATAIIVLCLALATLFEIWRPRRRGRGRKAAA